MIRDLLGLLALDVLYLLVGLSFLAALGLRSPGLPGLALGLATGWAVIGIECSLALVAGLSLGVPEVVLLAAVSAAGGAWIARRRRAPRATYASATSGPWARPAALGGIAVLALAGAAALARGITATADTEWDSWAFWVPKAMTVYYDAAPEAFLDLPNPEYPPFAPVLDGVAFGFVGGVDPSLLVLQHLVVVAAALLGIGALLRLAVPAAFVWPPLAMIAVAPAALRYFDSVLADPPLALALGIASVAGTLWILERRPELALLAALFLAAAALLKSEGLLLGYLLVAVLAVAGGFRRRGELAVLAVAPALAVVPWKVWLAARDIQLSADNYDFAKVADPGYLLDRADRLSFALAEMSAIAFAPDLWLLTLPLALVAAALAALRRPALAATALGWPIAAFLGLATIYWISPAPVEWYVDTSAQRVLLSVQVVSASLLPLTLLQLTTRPRQDDDDEGRGGERDSGPRRIRLPGGDGVAVVEAANGDRDGTGDRLRDSQPRSG